MELINSIVDFIAHLDLEKLGNFFNSFGIWAYLIIFLIIFCETGLVVTPFLPGDSLIFFLGALSASGEINVWLILAVLAIAAIFGDSANYFIGKTLGHTFFNSDNIRFFNRKNLDKTHRFFEKYGSKTIIISRFVPIVRTFAPFAAGMGCMPYMKFVVYNIIGGVSWVTLFITGGYLLAKFIPKDKFWVVEISIIVISLLPIIIEYVREKNKSKKEKTIS
jgi:membrane-associated protein